MRRGCKEFSPGSGSVHPDFAGLLRLLVHTSQQPEQVFGVIFEDSSGESWIRYINAIIGVLMRLIFPPRLATLSALYARLPLAYT